MPILISEGYLRLWLKFTACRYLAFCLQEGCRLLMVSKSNRQFFPSVWLKFRDCRPIQPCPAQPKQLVSCFSAVRLACLLSHDDNFTHFNCGYCLSVSSKPCGFEWVLLLTPMSTVHNSYSSRLCRHFRLECQSATTLSLGDKWLS
jgi:hypothetical protein